jgi:hypothetical protein
MEIELGPRDDFFVAAEAEEFVSWRDFHNRLKGI